MSLVPLDLETCELKGEVTRPLRTLPVQWQERVKITTVDSLIQKEEGVGCEDSLAVISITSLITRVDLTDLAG